MADPPSPYAPGIIRDEPVPSRPAGRAVVFLVATFVMTIVASGTMWPMWAERSLIAMGGDVGTLRRLTAIGAIPAALTLLWAYLSDAVPLWGTRREGYLLLTGLMMATVWLVLAFASDHHVVWIVAVLQFGLAASVSHAAIFGALAEIGQRRAATGRLAAAYLGLGQLGVLVSLPLAAAGAVVPPLLIAGVAAGLSLAVVALIATLSDEGSPLPVPVPALSPRVGIPRFLGSRAFWASLAVLICAGNATVPRELIAEPPAGAPDLAFAWRAQSMMYAGMIAAAVVYLASCRRVRFGTLLRGTLFVKALALVAHALASRGMGPGMVEVAFMARAAANSLLACALLDLTMRVAPRGREAFATILLAGGLQVVIALSTVIETARKIPVARVAWFAAGAAVAAAMAVSLLPRTIVETREGRVVGSPP